MWKNLFQTKNRYFLLFMILLAIGIRLYGVFQPAQNYDISTYESWGKIMLAQGPANFFPSTWSDYLPLPIYFCSLIVILSDFLQLAFPLVFKFLVSFLELGLLLLLFRRLNSPRKWLLVPLLFLSPALIGDSAFWGQLDTLPALLTLLSFSYLPLQQPKSLSLRSIFSPAILFGLAVAFKPIMLLVLPIFFLIIWSRYPLYFLLFSLFSFLTFLLPALPVDFLHPLSFLIKKTLEQASTYQNTTINAWNVWSIIPLHNSWPPDNQTIFSLSAHNFGLIIFFVLAFNVFRNWHKHHYSQKYLYKIAALTFLIFYTFTTRMHERHLLFGLPFLALATLTEPWLLVPFLLYSLFFVLNLFGAFYWIFHAQTWPFSELFISLISWCNVILTLVLTFVWDWSVFWKKTYAWLKSNRILVIILLLATSLRLVNLGYPDKYIFDEVYHSFTARQYLHNNVAAWQWWTTPPKDVAYEWTHPPMAKYGMVAGMLMFGENSFGWRFGSAVMGVISILGLYALTLALTRQKSTALIAAFLVSIEGLHLVQSRIGMNDIYMLAFLVWSLYCAVKNRWKYSAILFGLSLASKWSAIYGLFPLALIYLHNKPFPFRSILHTSYFILQILRLIAIAALVYLLSFTPFILAGHSWAQLLELHRQMWYYHTHLVATHAYESTPWQWFFSLRPVWYFVDYGPATANIYAQSNPFILWLGLFAFFFTLLKIKKFPVLFFLTSYLIFTLPWLLSPRIMFFYHYLPSVFFLTSLLAIWLTQLSKNLRLALILICSLSFIFIAPMYFGTHMLPIYWDTIFQLFPTWK